jgi:hypothetical protein
MFRRRKPMQNRVVAAQMSRFFRDLPAGDRMDLENVAQRYGRHLWNAERGTLVSEKKLSRSRFHIGISTDGSRRAFEDLTKRATLVTDTLLLSHDWTGGYHELGIRFKTNTTEHNEPVLPTFADWRAPAMIGPKIEKEMAEAELNNLTTAYGMHCPDLNGLGKWILDTEPLLSAGLAWYLPSYSFSHYETVDGVRVQDPFRPSEQLKVIDFLLRDGRMVDATGAEPIKSQLVRPVLRAELPFLEGLALDDFSRITVEEFDSYLAFRDFLRQSLLAIDESLNEVQSERALIKLGIEINNGLRAVRADLERASRRRAVAVTGASLGTVSTVLVAVYGPALATAIAAIGASGGVWGVINAMTENSPRTLRENKWYYVWAMATKTNAP